MSMPKEDFEKLQELAKAGIGAIKQNLWNPAGTWPDDHRKQASRPRDYWVGTVGGHAVGYEGVYGCSSRKEAIAVASKFRNKCREMLAEYEAV